MRIELERALSPEDLRPERCGICEGTFEPSVVRAQVVGLGEWDGGRACEECVEFMGRHPSGRFPTVEEYRRLEAEWRVPVYANVKVLELAEAAWG